MYTDHWIYKYIGLKWTTSYNCFDHFVDVQESQFKVKCFEGLYDVPNFEDRAEALAYIKTNPKLTKWKEIHPNMAREGDAVLFGVEDVSFHIGTFVDSGTKGVDKHTGVLHCDKSCGVTLTGLLSIRIAKSKITFMRLTSHD